MSQYPRAPGVTAGQPSSQGQYPTLQGVPPSQYQYTSGVPQVRFPYPQPGVLFAYYPNTGTPVAPNQQAGVTMVPPPIAVVPQPQMTQAPAVVAMAPPQVIAVQPSCPPQMVMGPQTVVGYPGNGYAAGMAAGIAAAEASHYSVPHVDYYTYSDRHDHHGHHDHHHHHHDSCGLS